MIDVELRREDSREAREHESTVEPEVHREDDALLLADPQGVARIEGGAVQVPQIASRREIARDAGREIRCAERERHAAGDLQRVVVAREPTQRRARSDAHRAAADERELQLRVRAGERIERRRGLVGERAVWRDGDRHRQRRDEDQRSNEHAQALTIPPCTSLARHRGARPMPTVRTRLGTAGPLRPMPARRLAQWRHALALAS